MLHNKRKAAGEGAKKKYIKYIDEVVAVRHGDFCLDVEHECKSDSPNSIYKNHESENNELQVAKHQPLRDARLNGKCRDIDSMHFISGQDLDSPENGGLVDLPTKFAK